MTTFKQIFKNVSFNWAGLAISIVLGFLQAPIVVIGLGNFWYGVWVLIQQLTSYGWLFDIGIREAVIRYVSKYKAQNDFESLNSILGSAIYLYLFISTITVVIVLALVVALPYLFKINAEAIAAARVVLFLGGLNIAINWLFNTYTGILMGLSRFDIVQKIGVITNLTSFLLVVTFIKLGFGIIALSLISICVNQAANILIFWQCKKLLPSFNLWRFDRDRLNFRELINYGKYILLNNIGTKIVDSSDAILIGIFLSPIAITIYAIPRLLIIYMEKLVGVTTWVLSPVFSEFEGKKDTKGIMSLLSMGSKISFLIGLPIGIVFLTMGKRFIFLWMGKEYAEAGGLILLILTISSVLGLWHHAIISALYGLSLHHIIAYLRVSQAAFSLTLFVIILGVLRWDINGVALAVAIPHVLIMFILLPVIVCRKLKIRLIEYIKNSFFYPVLSSIPFGISCYLVNVKFPADSLLSFFGWVCLLIPLYLCCVCFVCFSKRERIDYAKRIYKFVAAG